MLIKVINKQDLEYQIRYHRYKYWVDNDPEITDPEYDQLVEQLRSIDPRNKLLTEIEYNYNFTGEEVTHPKPMLSLEKCFSYSSILNWMKKVARSTTELFLITPKYDGISARYYARQNILATRGDGLIGENITSKIPLLKFESKSNDNKNNRSLNGEIIISYEEFNKCKLRTKSGKAYATPRNLVAGIMNIKDTSSLEDKIQLLFIEHHKYETEVAFKDFTETYWNGIIKNIKEFSKLYPLDGIVLSLKDELYSDSLGVTAHHPKGKIAFKFEDNYKVTTLKDVIFQTGKRKLTPVAIIEPTEINGVTIKRVTLHNAKMLIDNNIHIGDQLKIVRSGDVIPYVTGVIPEKNPENRQKIIINHCPNCGCDLEYIEPDLYCTNSECIGITSKLLYESVKTLGVEGIGQTTIDKFVEYLGCQNILDIINLTVDDIIDLPDFGEISANNIINAIGKVTSNIEDYKVLASLNIENVGVQICKEICKEYYLAELFDLTDIELSQIPGIGYIRASQIENSIKDNQKLLKDLIESLTIKYTRNIVSNSKGTICFSGTFPNKKEYYRQLAIQAGFEVVESVTQDIHYLVTAGAATSKVSKARKYGVPVIRLDDFMRLVETRRS